MYYYLAGLSNYQLLERERGVEKENEDAVVVQWGPVYEVQSTFML